MTNPNELIAMAKEKGAMSAAPSDAVEKEPKVVLIVDGEEISDPKLIADYVEKNMQSAVQEQGEDTKGYSAKKDNQMMDELLA